MKNKIIYYIFLNFFLFLKVSSTYADENSSIIEYCSSILDAPPENIKIDRFSAGVSNRVYLLSTNDGKRVVAKIFTKRSLEDVYLIDQTTSALHQIGFKIPETIAILNFQNKFPLQISKFQEGRHVTDCDLNPVAKLMAKLHKSGSLINSLPPEKYKDDQHYRALFKKCEKWVHTEELKAIYEEIDLDYLSEIPKGIIHGDFSYSNLIHSEEELTLIDFDHVCTSYFLTDLVRCHMFYGFDENGILQEQKVKNFAANYNAVRPITDIEMENFYSHMKLMMIDTALEMYYHLNVVCDLSKDVIDCEENKTLIPELLVKKIQNLRGRRTLRIDTENFFSKVPLIFFGMSGAGKTTMIKGLVDSHPELFYIPVFTCTRNPRPDDDLNQFEYVSIQEFLSLEQQGDFLFTMHEGDRYYGYRKSNLSNIDKHALLNCSPYGLDNAKIVNGILILITGDTEKGLMNRNNPLDYHQRNFINHRVFDQFYSKSEFLEQMHIIHLNEWSKQETSILNLEKMILEKIDEFKKEHRLRDAA